MQMKYKEPLFSKLIYKFLEGIRFSKKIIKKLRKIWKQRREYLRKDYFINKKNNYTAPISKVDKKMEINITSDSQNQIDKLAVYTCVYGNYDKIKEPLYVSKYCDYYIVTDQEIPSRTVWKRITPKNVPEGFEYWHPAIKNRYYKIHPEELFEEYTYSLYIDGNIKPITDMYPFLVELKKSNKWIGVFSHPIFNCCYDAAEVLKEINLVDHNIMDSQIKGYKDAGFPIKYGYVECGLILRNHKNKSCKLVMKSWWEEYSKGVKRDQQSFPYSLWKNGYTISAVYSFGKNIRSNSRVRLYNHKRVHEKV